VNATAASTSFASLGTTAQVVVDRDDALAAARDLLVGELDAIDRACSRFRGDSELMEVNARAGHTTPLSPLLCDAIAVALNAAAQTGGAVDPTIGPALGTLGYDRDFDAIARGTGCAVSGVAATGWWTVALDARARTIRLAPTCALDLGATAKAFAADRAAARIAQETGAGVLVDLGGDIAVAGLVPSEGWPVLVSDDHRDRDPEAGQTIAVHGGGLASSSTWVRRWERAGRVLHHIIDPRTGEPADPVWRTVTVAAGSCVDANTASAAAVVKGRSAVDWLAGLGLPARLVAECGAITTVGDWPEAA
jgi:FAD:protein FMN transferase